MNWDIAVKLLIAGNAFALLAFGVGQLLVKSKQPVNYWSFAFFTYSAALFLFSAAINARPRTPPTDLVWADFLVVSLTGPLFFFYFSRLADPDYRFAWKDQWLFLPPALFVIATPIVYPKGGAGFYAIASRASNVSILWDVVCCVLFLARTIKREREGRPGERRRLRFLIAIAGGVTAWAVAFCACALAGLGLGPLILAATLFIMAVYFYHLRHPELLSSSPPANPPTPRQGRSKVAGLDLEATIDRLNRTMEEDKPYLEDDLSLPALAARVELSPHQLSEIINREIGASFKSYINGYRAKEAQRILREKPDASILDVALESGFRSKSAFNQVFHEETGTTPTDYRRRARSGGGGE